MKNVRTNKKLYSALFSILFFAGVSFNSSVFAASAQQNNEEWMAFANSLATAQSGAVLEYSATGSENFIPHCVFQQLSGKNVTARIKRNGEIWTFNGNNLNGFNVNENQYYQTLAALGYLTGIYAVPNLGVSPPAAQTSPVPIAEENEKNTSENQASYGEYK